MPLEDKLCSAQLVDKEVTETFLGVWVVSKRKIVLKIDMLGNKLLLYFSPVVHWGF